MKWTAKYGRPAQRYDCYPPGTEKEISQSFQIPKGLIIGFTWDDAFEDQVELYIDSACPEAYDPYMNTDSDLNLCKMGRINRWKYTLHI